MSVVEKVRGMPHNFFRRDLPSKEYFNRQFIDSGLLVFFGVVSAFEAVDGDYVESVTWLVAAGLTTLELIRNSSNGIRSSKREYQQQLTMAQQTFQEKLQTEVPDKGYEIMKALVTAEKVARDHNIETSKFLKEWVGSLGIEE